MRRRSQSSETNPLSSIVDAVIIAEIARAAAAASSARAGVDAVVRVCVRYLQCCLLLHGIRSMAIVYATYVLDG